MDRGSSEAQQPLKPDHRSSAIQPYSEFNPRKYIQEYYSTLGTENKFLLEFYHESYKQVSPDATLLEFGGGPTIYQLLSAGLKVKEIVFAEHLQQNRQEVAKWIRGDPDAIDWNDFIQYVLHLNHADYHGLTPESTGQNIKPKITEIIECDAYLPDILAGYGKRTFDVVSSSFCLECVSTCEQTFVESLKKITGFVKENGLLMLTLLKNAHSYQIDNLSFPAFPVNEPYMSELLEQLGYSDINIQTVSAEHEQGYEGLMAMTGRKQSRG